MKSLNINMLKLSSKFVNNQVTLSSNNVSNMDTEDTKLSFFKETGLLFPRSTICCISLANDGSFYYQGDSLGNIEKALLKGERALTTKKQERIFNHKISSIVITADDKFLFISSKIGELVQYNIECQCIIKSYDDINYRIHDMVIRGNYLFAASDFGNFFSIDIKNQKLFSNNTIKNCPDLKCIAVANDEETLFIADSLGNQKQYKISIKVQIKIADKKNIKRIKRQDSKNIRNMLPPLPSNRHRRPSPDFFKKDENRIKHGYQNINPCHIKKNSLSFVNSESELNEYDIRENYKKSSEKVFDIGTALFENDSIIDMNGSRRFDSDTPKSPVPLDYCFKHELVLDYGVAHTYTICDMEIEKNDCSLYTHDCCTFKVWNIKGNFFYIIFQKNAY